MCARPFNSLAFLPQHTHALFFFAFFFGWPHEKRLQFLAAPGAVSVISLLQRDEMSTRERRGRYFVYEWSRRPLSLWRRVINHLPRSTSLIESEKYIYASAGACLKIARLLRDLLSSFVLGQFCLSLAFLSNSLGPALWIIEPLYEVYDPGTTWDEKWSLHFYFFAADTTRRRVDLLSTNFQP